MPRWKRPAGVLAASVLLIVTVFVCGCDAGGGRPRVIKVFDGDTVLLSSGEKVRLIGIDCPEEWESDKLFRDARRSGKAVRVIQEEGRRAAAFTRRVVSGREVLLEFDQERRDKYGRLLAYIYIPIAGGRPDKALRGQLYETDFDGTPCYFLNASIVQAGYASLMTIPPNVKHADLFRTLYQSAREHHAGLWNGGT